VIQRTRATAEQDLPHEYDSDDDGWCAVCGYDEDEDIHRVTSLRVVADAQRMRRELGI
jgi:hypothetical protein